MVKRIPAVAAILFFSTLVSSAFAASKPLTHSEKAVVTNLEIVNLAEIKMGGLAHAKAENPAVKSLGTRLAGDHQKLESKVKQWAAVEKLTLPTQLPAQVQGEFNKMSKMSGKTFDRAYTEAMLNGHRGEIANLQKALATSQNKALKSLLCQTLPILENHIRVAENVAGKLGLGPEKGLNHPEHPSANWKMKHPR